MEPQPRFDLTAAITNWQQELAQQPDLTPVVRRELETHLRDTVAELQARGLNNEESFWLARRRVGQPDQLGQEFAKADPAKIWRERVFWSVLALLGVDLWTRIILASLDVLLETGNYSHTDSMVLAIHLLFIWVPLVVFAVQLSKGRFDFTGKRWHAFLQSRICIAAVSAACILFFSTVSGISYWTEARSYHTLSGLFSLVGHQIPWPCLLLGLSLWLMPREHHRTPASKMA